MKTISIVIPVYNSSESLYKINDEINDYFDKSNQKFEKIFVNDASSDGSFNVLKRIALRFEEIEKTKVINLKYNVGQQNAIFCGFNYASGDYIVTMDDDLQHNIKYIDQMIKKIEAGAELVYGVCDIKTSDKIYGKGKNEFVIRSFGSSLTALFFKSNFMHLLNKRVSSFRVFDRKLLDKVLSCKYKFIYISAIMLRQTTRVENVIIDKRSRDYGKSGYNLKKLILLFIKLNFYYSKYSLEIIKPCSSQYEISETINIYSEVNNEKSDDTRGRKMPS